MTPTNGSFMYKNKILYGYYMFRRHLRHSRGGTHQDLKPTKI